MAMVRFMFRSGFWNFPPLLLFGFLILTKMPTPTTTNEVPTAEKRSNGFGENLLEASSQPAREMQNAFQIEF